MNNIKVLFLVLSLSLSNICLGVLPPEYFLARERNAKIKAIAIVKSVKSGFYNGKTGIETQTVTFKTVSPLIDGKIPGTFTAYCYTMVKSTGYIGGERYYYPKESLGKHVYVAVSADGGQIVALKPLNKKEIIKLKDQFKNRNLLLGQINVKERVNSISILFNDLYLFKINGEVQGCLERRKNESYPQAYQSKLYFKENDSSKNYSVRTYYSGGAQFQLNEMHLEISGSKDKNKTYTFRFKYNSSKKPYSGILKKSGEYPAAKNTLSDFALFDIVTLLPFDKKQSLNFTVIESLELNVKKDMKLKFAGTENGLFKFVQLDAKGHCVAQYWLDKDHILLRVAWDKDKLFIKTNKQFTIKGMNSQHSQASK